MSHHWRYSTRTNEPTYINTATAWSNAGLWGDDTGESVGRVTNATVLQKVRWMGCDFEGLVINLGIAELTPCASQVVQVSTDGLRDGNMGDDKSLNSAEEGLSVNLLPCITIFPSPKKTHLLIMINIETYASSHLLLPSLRFLMNHPHRD